MLFKTSIKILLIGFSLCAEILPQDMSNLDVFYKLADSTVNEIVRQLPDTVKNVDLNLNFSGSYEVFKNKFLMDFNGYGIKETDNKFSGGKHVEINITVDKTNVIYSGMFRKSLLGDFAVNRSLSLGGSYVITGSVIKSDVFNFVYNDSVNVDDIPRLENSALSFTQGRVPPEPFLSNLYEPIIAIGAAAVAVFLFFTIRSK
jgi:hypothetical protein